MYQQYEQGSLKESIQDAIIATNVVLLRWREEELTGARKKDISTVYSLVKGCFHRFLKDQIGWRRYRHVVKEWGIAVDNEGRYVSKVDFPMLPKTDALSLAVRDLDYIELANIAREDFKEEITKSYNNFNEINFHSIESIKF